MFLPKAYEGEEPYIFISYAHLDSERVIPIIQGLQNRGFRVWYDAGIEAGTEWPEYIATRLDGCTCFLALISKNAVDSHNCRREINFAIELGMDPLAIYLEDVMLSKGMRMQLGTLQAMFYNRHSSMDAFLDVLAASKMLAPCKGAASVANMPATAACTYTPPADPGQLFAEGQRSEAAGDYQKAFDAYTKAAELGHSDALGALGTMYAAGNGPAHHAGEVVKLLRVAAEKGHIMAQLALGIMYYDGKGVPQDLAESVKWYRMAAEKGVVQAQFQLANLYSMQAQLSQLDSSAFSLALTKVDPSQAQLMRNIRYQLGSTVNGYSEAVKFYRMAAETGNVDAQYALGNIYFQGAGVAKDYSEAMKWYQMAAQQGHGGAQCMTGHLYARGLGITQNSDEAARWYSMAAMWCQTAAQSGNVDAQCHLGFMYKYGIGATRDHAEAAKWYRMAALNGNRDAEIALGGLYEFGGPGLNKDWAEAAKWYRMAADNGHAYSWVWLGDLYYSGDPGLNKDHSQAAAFYRMAAEKGDAYGQYKLARMYADGDGVEKDGALAFYWFRKSAEQGEMFGQEGLGRCYEEGIGVPIDLETALKWYEKSGSFINIDRVKKAIEANAAATVQITCQHCGRSFNAPKPKYLDIAKCPHCGQYSWF